LRHSVARDGRQRGKARRQVQKLPSVVKFHDRLPGEMMLMEYQPG
jgi:hypothetical protein